jgi:D-alanyl-lipoteichoic acid acyltransferase DltB (MBOAT superfamily)
MLFNSFEFIMVFLPVVLSGFYLIGNRGRHRVAIAWLVMASLFFYAWWNPAYLGLILFSVLFNYAFGLLLSGGSVPYQRLLLATGIAINLGLLGYFKYANFFVDNLNAVAGTDFQLSRIILPLAISFFTFQQIAFLVDSYRRETHEFSFLHYCLFVTFFPQLIAGPIVHHREMLPQFVSDTIYRFDLQRIMIGLSVFIIGLSKKVLIADTLSDYASPVFAAADSQLTLTFFESWGGVLAYTFQLYFDFSGYSDMAIGLAFLFGIVLPVNFFSPYKSLSIIEFWRRWHMTLSRFLKDYVYIPLGGNRKGSLNRYRNLFLTMLIGGVWHGAGWTFVIWGGLHGLFLMINHAWLGIKTYTGLDRLGSNRLTQLPAFVLTFTSVVVAWVFFRAESLDGAMNMLVGMSGSNGAQLDYRLAGILSPMASLVSFEGVGCGSLGSVWAFLWIGLAAFIALFLPNTYVWISHYLPVQQFCSVPSTATTSRLSFAFRWYWGIVLGIIAGLSVFGMSRVSEFLYFQF